MTDAVDPRIAEAYRESRLAFVPGLTDSELCALHRATLDELVQRDLDARVDRAEAIIPIAIGCGFLIFVGFLIGWWF